MYEIAVCDDSSIDRTRLIELIQKNNIYKENVHIHEYSSGIELLNVMNEIAFAMVFMDIQMQGINGDEIATRIRTIDPNVVLVFYTGYAEPSPKTFEVQPFRYIMKNMKEQQMSSYIDDALRYMIEKNSHPLLLANVNRERVIIKADHIIYIEKYKKGTRAQIAKYAYATYGLERNWQGRYPDIRLVDKLETLYKTLKRHGFGCPHDSYVVNLNYITACTAKSLRLAEIEGEFQITRSKAKEFNEHKDCFIRSKYVGKR